MKTLDFEKALLATWLDSGKNIKEIVIKWVIFYENMTGHKIDKSEFEIEPNGQTFMGIMNQMQNHRNMKEEITRIKKLL